MAITASVPRTQSIVSPNDRAVFEGSSSSSYPLGRSNARFQQMFPRMFGGGRAELRLTDTENLRETGIDIIAMPPGKKLTSIELMSGGEKALTAVALIFAAAYVLLNLLADVLSTLSNPRLIHRK